MNPFISPSEAASLCIEELKIIAGAYSQMIAMNETSYLKPWIDRRDKLWAELDRIKEEAKMQPPLAPVVTVTTGLPSGPGGAGARQQY